MRFARRYKPRINVDLIPMVDVVFQLVVFFLVSTTFIVTPGIGLVFPSSSTAQPVAVTRLVVTVVSSEEIYLNQERMNIPDLSAKLGGFKRNDDDAGSERTVLLEAAEETPYRLMVEVLDVLRKNGYRGVNLKTKRLSDSHFGHP